MKTLLFINEALPGINLGIFTSGVIGFLFILTVVTLFFVYLWNYGKKQAVNASVYERMYESIELSIEHYEINCSNYDAILERLQCLGQLPYKNPEMTAILTIKFFVKYEQFTEKKNWHHKLLV